MPDQRHSATEFSRDFSNVASVLTNTERTVVGIAPEAASKVERHDVGSTRQVMGEWIEMPRVPSEAVDGEHGWGTFDPWPAQRTEHPIGCGKGNELRSNGHVATRQRGSRGRPSTRSPKMLRMMFEVPPMIV
jgi:hypothetical protein